MALKYCIVGTGGVGGTHGFYMARAGKDVTFIARGRQLEALQTNGLTLHRRWEDVRETIPVKAYDMEHYPDRPDVIIVCLKSYSMADVVPFVKRIAKKDTIVLPVCNVFNTGGELQKLLPDTLCLDGCTYVVSEQEAPGVILQHIDLARIIFGAREEKDERPVLAEIERDLLDSGIRGKLSHHIRRDHLQKFAYVSPAGAVGLYCDCTAEGFQKEGEPRELFKAMIREICALADALGCPFDQDVVALSLNIHDHQQKDTTTSLQRDVLEGRRSEFDGLIDSPIRLGESVGLDMPAYRRVSRALHEKFDLK